MSINPASIVVPSKIKMNIINLSLSRRLDLTKVDDVNSNLTRLSFENISSIEVVEEIIKSVDHIYDQSFKQKEKP